MDFSNADIEKVDFSKLNGLIPAIAQDYQTKEILMVGFMNKEALQKTIETGKATYFSRSRNKLWLKGESSGHYQIVKEIYIDCDEDTVVMLVEQIGGAACHLGYNSCFFRRINKDGNFEDLGKARIFDPEEVYKNGK